MCVCVGGETGLLGALRGSSAELDTLIVSIHCFPQRVYTQIQDVYEVEETIAVSTQLQTHARTAYDA